MHAPRRFGVVGGKPDEMGRQAWFIRDTVTGTHVEGPFCSIGLAMKISGRMNEATGDEDWLNRMRTNDHA